MSFLTMEQTVGMAMKALEDNGMSMEGDVMKIMLTPSYTVAMYLNTFCRLVQETGDYSIKNQKETAIYVMDDTIKHRWNKHLNPLKKNCQKSFSKYYEKELQHSDFVIKTLSYCLMIMTAFENLYCYDSLGADDPVAMLRDKFIEAMFSGVPAERLAEMIPPNLRGDTLIEITFLYFWKMCDYLYKPFTDAIFRKNTTIDESEGSDALDYEDYNEYDDGLIA